MNVLVIDVGGTNIKILATGQKQSREFPSGITLTAQQMVEEVKKLARDWKYDAVSIGYPGPVIGNRLIAEPHKAASLSFAIVALRYGGATSCDDLRLAGFGEPRASNKTFACRKERRRLAVRWMTLCAWKARPLSRGRRLVCPLLPQAK